MPDGWRCAVCETCICLTLAVCGVREMYRHPLSDVGGVRCAFGVQNLYCLVPPGNTTAPHILV
jgi:hypothetical protein